MARRKNQQTDNNDQRREKTQTKTWGVCVKRAEKQEKAPHHWWV